jgi:hypothetical protein
MLLPIAATLPLSRPRGTIAVRVLEYEKKALTAWGDVRLLHHLATGMQMLHGMSIGPARPHSGLHASHHRTALGDMRPSWT